MAYDKVFIKNKRASFDYELLDRFVAGIKLAGTEVKAVRQGLVNLKDSFCLFRKGELFVKSIHIAEYTYGSVNNHTPERVRKLLLNKRELKKLEKGLKEKGYTIIPTAMYLSERGFVKLEIALAKGKRRYDKRQSIKKKDIQREIDRGRA